MSGFSVGVLPLPMFMHSLHACSGHWGQKRASGAMNQSYRWLAIEWGFFKEQPVPSLWTKISKFKLGLIFRFIDFEISTDLFLHKCNFMKTLTWIANKSYITIISKIFQKYHHLWKWYIKLQYLTNIKNC